MLTIELALDLKMHYFKYIESEIAVFSIFRSETIIYM